MKLLYFLESIRIPGLNECMLFVTKFGEETVFLVAALILFWCVDKYRGYYILSVGFVGTILNQFLKLLFRIPRPWVLDENFTILEKAREAATGYSFPSGHTQSAVGTFGGIAHTSQNRCVKIACVVIAVLVPISRMYVGVHTPLDVSVAAVTALILLFALRPVANENGKKKIPYLLGGMVALAIAYLMFVELFPFPANIDPYNLESGKSNAYTLFGALLGLVVVYIVDEKWLDFPTKAVWWAQVIKVVIGLLLVLVVKSSLKQVLNACFGVYIGRAVRYGLIVIIAGILWPLSFQWFSNLGSKE